MATTHNFRYGIDWTADPSGATPLAKTFFASKNGNDSTGTGTPLNPVKSFAKLLSLATVDTCTFVLGAGIYPETNIAISTRYHTVYFDGYVLMQGDNVGAFCGTTTSAYGIGAKLWNGVLKDYAMVTFGDSGGGLKGAENTTFLNIPTIRSGGGSNGFELTNCWVVNCAEVKQGGTIQIRLIGSRVVNSSVIFSTNHASHLLASTYFHSDTTIQLAAGWTGTKIQNCCINGAIVIEGVRYATLADARAVHPTFFTGCFSTATNPFPGLSQFEALVPPNSPLLGAGVNAVNVGFAKTGLSFKQGVAALDNAVAANPDIAYSALGELQLTGASSVLTMEEVVFEYMRYLGAIRITGVLDMLNSIPDFDNTGINPNHLTLELRTAQADGIYTAWRKFRWNEVPTENSPDANGYRRSNGEQGFNWGNLVLISAMKWQARITLRNDYIEN